MLESVHYSQFASYERKKDFYNMIELAIKKKDYQPFIKSYQSRLEGKERHKQSITFYATLEDAFNEFSQNRRQVCDIVYALFPTSPNLTKIRLEFVISLIGRALEFRNSAILDCLSYYLDNCKNLTSQKLEFLYRFITADLIDCSEEFCACLISGGQFQGKDFPMNLIEEWLPRLNWNDYGTATYETLLEYLFENDSFDSSLMSFILICLDTDPGSAENLEKEFVLSLSKCFDNSDPKVKYSQYFALLIRCNIAVDFGDSDTLKKYPFFKKLTDYEKTKLSNLLSKYHNPVTSDSHVSAD